LILKDFDKESSDINDLLSSGFTRERNNIVALEVQHSHLTSYSVGLAEYVSLYAKRSHLRVFNHLTRIDGGDAQPGKSGIVIYRYLCGTALG
jgi:hypothetical protein